MATSGYGTLYAGGKGGRRTAVTPKSLSAQAVKRTITAMLPLGAGAVSGGTFNLPPMGIAGKVVDIRFSAQVAVTGTTLTAEVSKWSEDGATSTTLQSAATDIKFASANAARAGVAAALTATTADLTVTAGRSLSVAVGATSITGGPSYVGVTVTYVPTEDTRSGNRFSMGADLL